MAKHTRKHDFGGRLSVGKPKRDTSRLEDASAKQRKQHAHKAPRYDAPRANFANNHPHDCFAALAFAEAESILSGLITGWEAGARAAQLEDESCRRSHHVHRRVFNQIVRDAEIAYAISPIIRKHDLTAEEAEKFLLELRIPRAANVAGITDR